MSNNSHGNKNEIEIVNYLNNKKIKELNLNCKEFIKYIAKTKNILIEKSTRIFAEYEENNRLKQDFYIRIGDKKFGISCKMGSGNSCHQEKITDFIQYIKEEFNASDDICSAWLFFIWADGTTDGSGSKEKDSSGKIKCRFSSSVFKKNYPNKRKLLQRFLDKNIEALLTHVLFEGRFNSCVDFIYHGTFKNGRWISKEAVIDYQKKLHKHKSNTCLNLGNLSAQAWNISQKGTSEKKRGVIQFKYSKMSQDFDAIMKNSLENIGTFQGNIEEYNLSKILNSNKTNQMWKILLPYEKDFSSYFIIKVSNKQYSELSKKYVLPKSDAYIVKGNFSNTFLLSKEFNIEEDDIKTFEYKIVSNSGISIKKKDSNTYTIQKLTRNSFLKLFSILDDANFIMASLLIYSNPKETYKNTKILNDFGYTENTFFKKCKNEMNIEYSKDDQTLFWNTIRQQGQKIVKKTIKENIEIWEKIFTGKGWFKDPYFSSFIYSHGKIQKCILTDFSITTGSGRSKGIYTIEIRPC